MKKLLVIISAVFTLLTVSGCSTIHSAEEAVADVEQGTAKTQVYALDKEQAEQVILKSFAQAYSDKTPQKVESGRLGYGIKLWFAIDREHVYIYANPVSGGYEFEIINRGTAPVVGVPAREELTELVNTYSQQYIAQ